MVGVRRVETHHRLVRHVPTLLDQLGRQVPRLLDAVRAALPQTVEKLDDLLGVVVSDLLRLIQRENRDLGRIPPERIIHPDEMDFAAVEKLEVILALRLLLVDDQTRHLRDDLFDHRLTGRVDDRRVLITGDQSDQTGVVERVVEHGLARRPRRRNRGSGRGCGGTVLVGVSA
jgi:hypothetical protein